MRQTKQRHPFHINAIVVLPDHLHTIWTLPDDDADYSMCWCLIKAGFSRGLPKIEHINQSRRIKRERGIWQRRYWEHQIRDDLDYQRHVDDIHYNPVKHGNVGNPGDWRYSSIHAFFRSGQLPVSWCIENSDDKGFGE